MQVPTTDVHMFGAFKSRVETLVADRGRVACPSRGRDTDVDHCFDCPRVREIVREPDATLVRCEPVRRRPDVALSMKSRRVPVP